MTQVIISLVVCNFILSLILEVVKIGYRVGKVTARDSYKLSLLSDFISDRGIIYYVTEVKFSSLICVFLNKKGIQSLCWYVPFWALIPFPFFLIKTSHAFTYREEDMILHANKFSWLKRYSFEIFSDVVDVTPERLHNLCVQNYEWNLIQEAEEVRKETKLEKLRRKFNEIDLR